MLINKVSTIPLIYIDSKFVGGYTDTVKKI